jgi:hypothetical protein
MKKIRNITVYMISMMFLIRLCLASILPPIPYFLG